MMSASPGKGAATKSDRWFIDEPTDRALADIDAALPGEEPPPPLWDRIRKDLDADAEPAADD